MIGRVWTWDEGRGGAYYLDGGVLCHAEWLPEAGRFDWECGAQVDSRDLLSGDPGWDYAKWAEQSLWKASSVIWCPVCLVEGHEAEDCPEAPEPDVMIHVRPGDLTDEEMETLAGIGA